MEKFSFRRAAMGTYLNITFYAANANIAEDVVNNAFERVRELNGKLSDYDPDSEVNLLCQNHNVGQWIKVSEELFEVLSISKRISKSTKGRFDVTIGGYSQLWRSSKENKESAFIDAENYGSGFGYRDLHLKAGNRTVKIDNDKIRLDFGGIAKGYVADQLILLLNKHQLRHILIDFGGDLSTGDPPPSSKGWKVRVDFESERGKDSKVLLVKNMSVATSGDLFQKISHNGRTFSHIIDPSTGMWATKSIQVTVMAGSGALADSYATAFNVMDIDQVKKLLGKKKNRDVHALISYMENGTRKVWSSPYFNKFLYAQDIPLVRSK
ncbi:FAD:protein FMN transferase [Flagellimonas algicola]|uniref:FAD:protein FMN transferase n=1 Tax=Flagellimonas algicola TaxID=2583815 RepID=A0ABY2WHD3_9FLAO|nr:FAD:protein FMN transferase [Allomuricauda algicola]TMU50712.1 FAD:protein FMN transferase [Allomuricauda algicola]